MNSKLKRVFEALVDGLLLFSMAFIIPFYAPIYTIINIMEIINDDNLRV